VRLGGSIGTAAVFVRETRHRNELACVRNLRTRPAAESAAAIMAKVADSRRARRPGGFAQWISSSRAEREHLPGGGDLGDLAVAALGDPFELLAQRPAALNGLRAASTSAQRSASEPGLEMWPGRALASELRTAGVSPAHAHRCRAVGKRSISATITMPRQRSMP
jgi:hypothetical protein